MMSHHTTSWLRTLVEYGCLIMGPDARSHAWSRLFMIHHSSLQVRSHHESSCLVMSPDDSSRVILPHYLSSCIIMSHDSSCVITTASSFLIMSHNDSGLPWYIFYINLDTIRNNSWWVKIRHSWYFFYVHLAGIRYLWMSSLDLPVVGTQKPNGWHTPLLYEMGFRRSQIYRERR